MSESSLHGLITRCPVLEFLLVHSSSGFRRLRINSRSLTRLCVRIDPNRYVTLLLDEISIDNAPRLQRLIYLYSIWDHDVSIYYAPKVETLYFLNNLQNFAKYVLPAASRVIQVIIIQLVAFRMVYVTNYALLPFRCGLILSSMLDLGINR